jgi:hypothetical protein
MSAKNGTDYVPEAQQILSKTTGGKRLSPNNIL